MFIDIRKYGESNNLEERKLRERYFDYYAADKGNLWYGGDRKRLLPNPCNMGDEWYEEAVEAIVGDLME